VTKELSEDTPPVHQRAQLVLASVLEDAAMQASNSIWAPAGALKLRRASVRDSDSGPPPPLRLPRDGKAVGLKQFAGSRRGGRRSSLAVQLSKPSPKEDEEVRSAVEMRARVSEGTQWSCRAPLLLVHEGGGCSAVQSISQHRRREGLSIIGREG
jgi:hypothetical protein